MDAFRIQGGARLSGRIAIDGSKNACLPLMAAALLSDEPVTLRRVPALSDIVNMARLLKELGCHVEGHHGTITLSNVDSSLTHARYDIVRTMRAGICVLGPLLAKRKRTSVPSPRSNPSSGPAYVGITTETTAFSLRPAKKAHTIGAPPHSVNRREW